MKNLIKVTLSAAVVLSLPLLSSAESKSIYGADNRLDFYEASAGMQAISDSVVSLWKSYKVTENGAKYDLTTRTLGEAQGLCPGEKFREQKIGAFCSGSLVGEDLIMTAGHCIKTEADCAATKLVFGFKVAKAGDAGTSSVAKSEVYSCASIVKRHLDPSVLGADYALIKLDRKVTGHKALAINRTGKIAKDTKIFVIGHPSGMPLKVAADSKVRDASKTGYFIADLDTFGGNSGSAVFNLATNKIEGILVRGDNDYVSTPAGCQTVATFEQTGGRGEDVTKISELSSVIPKLPGEKMEPASMSYFSVPMAAPADNTRVALPILRNPF
ncbi:MAG TPA: serine protease [Elusimicrobiales bacterium]|nr:serine protease [Elusimicrobiales bacterium]